MGTRESRRRLAAEKRCPRPQREWIGDIASAAAHSLPPRNQTARTRADARHLNPHETRHPGSDTPGSGTLDPAWIRRPTPPARNPPDARNQTA